MIHPARGGALLRTVFGKLSGAPSWPPRADCLDGSGGAMTGSGLAAPAPILAAMFMLADGLRATPFPRAGCRVGAKYVATNTDE